MKHLRWAAMLTAILLVSLGARAQSAGASVGNPAFEVASVKPTPPGRPNTLSLGLHIDGAQVHAADFSLKDYIRTAYQLKYYQVEAPDWASSERFDLDAKLPDGATADQVPQMLQNLLAQRFGLASHAVTQPMAVYALEQASGGARLKASAPTTLATFKGTVSLAAAGSARGVALSLPGGAFFELSAAKGLEATHITMAVFADELGRFFPKPVVDATHLEGVYDLKLPLQPADYQSLLIQSAITAGVNLPPQALAIAAGASDSSLLSGLESNGLKMRPTTASVEVRVVDKLSKSPSGN